MHNLRALIGIGLPKDRGFVLGLAISALQALSAVSLMGVSAWLISRAAQQPPVLYLQIAVVLVRGFALGRATFRYVERLLLHDSAFRTLSNLRPRVYESLIPLAPTGLGHLSRGQTMSKFVGDVEELQNLPLRILPPLVQSVAVSALTVTFFAYVSPESALVLFVTLLLAFGVAIPVSSLFATRYNRQQSDHRGRLAGDTLDFLENLEVLEAFGWTDTIRSRINKNEDALIRVSAKQSLSAGLGQAMISLLATVATLGSTWFAAGRVHTEALPGVMLAAVALIPIAVFEVVMTAQPVISAWQRYRKSAGAVLDVISEPQEKLPEEAKQSLTKITSLELRQVSCFYPGSSSPAIDGFSLKLNQGKTLLLQGPTGSGKSSVAMLLLNFLRPTEGEYFINGIDSRSFDSDDIRKQIGYLEQTPTIFAGSIRANLLIGKPDASDNELWNTLERVGLRQLFSARDGLETELGERGNAVSGGEAQRIALARALLADFSVLIIDEPTSHVDMKVADLLIKDILTIVTRNSDRAIVLISHDPDHSAFVDSVIRLEP